jgi:hypothetical protein
MRDAETFMGVAVVILGLAALVVAVAVVLALVL